MRVEIPQTNLMIPLGIVWVAALVAGLVGVSQRLLTGHELANYTSAIPWGLWVAAYVYFVGLSAGAFLLSALIYVFGLRKLEPIGKLALFTAVVSLLAALLTIWLDIGHMERFYRVYTDGNPSSMMAWMVWLYTAYFVLLLAELWFVLRGDFKEIAGDGTLKGRVASLLLGRIGEAFGEGRPLAISETYDRAGDMRVVKLLGAIGVPVAVAFHGGVGALFGVVGARAFWNAPLVPLLFIVGALVSGGGLLTFFTAFLGPNRGSERHREMVAYLGRITLGLLAMYLIMVWAEYSITFYADIPEESEALYQVLGGPYPWVFWLFQVGLGALAPIVMMTMRPRSVLWVGVAGFLIAGTFLATRLNIVIPGLVEPQLEGLDAAYMDSRLSFDYFPSLMEWLVFIFFGAFGTGLFYAGYKLLPLTRRGKEVS